MEYLHIEKNEYDKLLDKDPKLIQADIIDFISFLKDKNASSASISVYVTALRKFYDLNDITQLNWKKIRSFEPARESVAEDRPYSHTEIKMLVDRATNLRNKAIILLMSSAGLRVGAIPSLRIKDLESLDNYGIYKINAYARTRQRYFSFCSPECRKAIDDYISHRKKWGERVKEDSPLFRTISNREDLGFKKVIPIGLSSIQAFIMTLARDCGLRDLRAIKGKHPRGDIMGCHGFRKFYESNAYKAGMDHMYIRRLMGQKSGLEDSYLKLSEEELLEGDSKHVGYVDIIDQLTINEENRLKREVQTLKIRADKIEKIMSEIEQVKKRIGLP
jgi:integrase